MRKLKLFPSLLVTPCSPEGSPFKNKIIYEAEAVCHQNTFGRLTGKMNPDGSEDTLLEQAVTPFSCIYLPCILPGQSLNSLRKERFEPTQITVTKTQASEVTKFLNAM